MLMLNPSYRYIVNFVNHYGNVHRHCPFVLVKIRPLSGLITGLFTRIIRWGNQEPLCLSRAPAFTPVCCGVRVAQYLFFCVMFCKSFCPFFFWSLHCLSFFDERLLIAPLLSPNYFDDENKSKCNFVVVPFI